MIGSDTLSDIGDGGFVIAHETDPGVKRFRPLVMVSTEMQQEGMPLVETRVRWRQARNYGRSQAVTLVCDSWRDSSGKLWTPNTQAKINIPSLKVDGIWIIGEVTYLRGENGTTAEVTLMPPEAYSPEPIAQTGFDWQVSQALSAGGAASSPKRSATPELFDS